MADPPPEPRPAWAGRMRAERVARDWSQLTAVRAMRAHSDRPLPSDETLLRNWRRWESGVTKPDRFNQKLIAAVFGTVTDAVFPPDCNAELIAATGMDTLEIISRIRASDVSLTALEALRITVERLCGEYPNVPPGTLQLEAQQWLQRMTGLLDSRLTLAQHREVLVIAGWLALLLGCVEYDLGQRGQAEATRQAAQSLGREADHADILGWAAEMNAWFALTRGNYPGVLTVTEAASGLTNSGVGAQLAAQRAKAWARIGDRRQVEIALDQGRTILENLPHPTNLDNHFAVDPYKFDFYAMDCYRIVDEPRMAELYANEVIRTSTTLDGTLLKPMRVAEARITLGVLAARSGDLDGAVEYGQLVLDGKRHSLPSLLMVGRELSSALAERYPNEPETREYIEQLRFITAGTS